MSHSFCCHYLTGYKSGFSSWTTFVFHSLGFDEMSKVCWSVMCGVVRAVMCSLWPCGKRHRVLGNTVTLSRFFELFFFVWGRFSSQKVTSNLCHFLLLAGDATPTNIKNKKGLSSFISVPRVGRAFLTLAPGLYTDLRTSGVFRHITRWLVPDILRRHICLIFMSRISYVLSSLDVRRLKWDRYFVPKRRGPLTIGAAPLHKSENLSLWLGKWARPMWTRCKWPLFYTLVLNVPNMSVLVSTRA